MEKMTEIRIETYDEGTTMNVIRKKIEEIKFDCINRPLRSGWRVVIAKFMIAPDPKDTKGVFVKSEVTTKIPGYISQTTGRIKNNVIYFQPNLPECDEEAVDASFEISPDEEGEDIGQTLSEAVAETTDKLLSSEPVHAKKDYEKMIKIARKSAKIVNDNPDIDAVMVVHSA